MRRLMINFPSAPPLQAVKRSQEFSLSSHTLYLNKKSRLSLAAPVPDMDKHIRLNTVMRRINLAYSNCPVNMRRLLEDTGSITSTGLSSPKYHISSISNHISLFDLKLVCCCRSVELGHDCVDFYR